MTFQQQMSGLSGIVVPTIHPEITSRKVIVSDWIDGKRMADADPAEVCANPNSVHIVVHLLPSPYAHVLHIQTYLGILM